MIGRFVRTILRTSFLVPLIIVTAFVGAVVYITQWIFMDTDTDGEDYYGL